MSHQPRCEKSRFFSHFNFTNMLRRKIETLMNEYGVKQEKIIEILETNRVTFGKKMKDNSFTPEDCHNINNKFGKFLN